MAIRMQYIEVPVLCKRCDSPIMMAIKPNRPDHCNCPEYMYPDLETYEETHKRVTGEDS